MHKVLIKIIINLWVFNIHHLWQKQCVLFSKNISMLLSLLPFPFFFLLLFLVGCRSIGAFFTAWCFSPIICYFWSCTVKKQKWEKDSVTVSLFPAGLGMKKMGREHHFIWNIKSVSSKLWVHQIPKGNNNLTSITFSKFLLLAKGANIWKITLESTVAKWKQHSKWIFRNIVLLLALVVFIYKVISKRLLFSWATPIHCRAWSRCFGFSQGFLSIFFFSVKNKTTGILGTIKCCLYL